MFNKKLNSLEGLFLEEIKDLYDAENQLLKALPKMEEAAESGELKAAFKHHLEETRAQVKRLEKVFSLLNEKPERETCEAMEGLISEGDEILSAEGNHRVRDAGLIAAAQRVEHYEMAGYGAARSFAETLGYSEVAELLQETLDEEGKADHTLTTIARQHVNGAAMGAAA